MAHKADCTVFNTFVWSVTFWNYRQQKFSWQYQGGSFDWSILSLIHATTYLFNVCFINYDQEFGFPEIVIVALESRCTRYFSSSSVFDSTTVSSAYLIFLSVSSFITKPLDISKNDFWQMISLYKSGDYTEFWCIPWFISISFFFAMGAYIWTIFLFLIAVIIS